MKPASDSLRPFWRRKPPWEFSALVVLVATYGPLCVLIVTVDSLPSGFIEPRTLLIPCHTLTPIVLIGGTCIGRMSFFALATVAGMILVATTFTAILTYGLLGA